MVRKTKTKTIGNQKMLSRHREFYNATKPKTKKENETKTRNIKTNIQKRRNNRFENTRTLIKTKIKKLYLKSPTK